MNISGIYGGAGRISANSYVSDIRLQELEEVNLQLEKEKEELDEAQLYAEARGNQTFGSIDYARTYQPEAVYDMKGADSDIRNLDVKKAVSDMKKDEVLHQYQFFAGSKFFRAGSDNMNPMGKIQDFTL